MTKERRVKPIHAALAAAFALAAGLAAPAAVGAVHAAWAERIQPAHFSMGHKGMGLGWARHIEGWIAFLETELDITDAQQPQWTAFADTLRDGAAQMRRLREELHPAREEGKEEPPMSAVERLERWERFAEVSLEALRGLNAAFKPLYEAMTEAQKQEADRLLSHRRWR